MTALCFHFGLLFCVSFYFLPNQRPLARAHAAKKSHSDLREEKGVEKVEQKSPLLRAANHNE